MRRIEKSDYEHDGSAWKLLMTTQYLYDGWDIVAAYVTTGNATTAHAYVYGADLSGTLGGAGGIGGVLAEAEDLQFTNYNLQFGGGDATKARSHEEEAVAATAGRGSVATAVPSHGSHGSAVGSDERGNGLRAAIAASSPFPKGGAGDFSERAVGPTTVGRTNVQRQMSNVTLYIYDSMGNVRNKVRVREGSPAVTATYEYDPYGRLWYAEPPPARETAPQFLFSTKLYESHWQQYYYGYRYYSPDLGRWLSRDPIYNEVPETLYAFVYNDPVLYVDGVGLDARGSFTIYVTEQEILATTDVAERHRKIADGAHRLFYFACNADPWNQLLMPIRPHPDRTLSYKLGQYKKIEYTIGDLSDTANSMYALGINTPAMNDGRGSGYANALTDLRDTYNRAIITAQEDMCKDEKLCLDSVKVKVVMDAGMLNIERSINLYKYLKKHKPKQKKIDCNR